MELIEAQGDGHFTAVDLAEEAAARGMRVGRATIFRTLDLLVNAGSIERLDLPDGAHAYVACEPTHHHHITCTNCGRSVDAPDGALSQVLRTLELQTGFVIDRHRLELYGRCGVCGRIEPAGR